MTGEWVSIEQHAPRDEDPPGHRDRHCVQQHDVDRIGAQVTGCGARGQQLRIVRIRSGCSEYGDVDIASRRKAARGGASEQICEEDVRARGRDSVTQSSKAGLDVGR